MKFLRRMEKVSSLSLKSISIMAGSGMARNMVKVWSKLYKVMNILDNGVKAAKMDLEKKLIQMATFMKECGNTINTMARVIKNLLMDKHTKVNFIRE